MLPPVVTILIIVLVVAAVVAAVLLARWMYKKRQPLIVDPEIKRQDAPKPSAQAKASRSPSSAGDAQRTMPRSRINIFWGTVVAVLGVLAAKVWSLQILNGGEYAEEAESNMTASASLMARRGRVLDRNGNVLINNRASRTVVADSTVLDDPKVVHRLSLALGVPKAAVRSRLMDSSSGAQSARVVASDVSMRALSFIAENPVLFPGVSAETRTIRQYPYGSLAAHLLGYTGTISEEELAEQKEGSNYESGDVVGKSGVESAFESVLQGTKGTRKYRVNSDGKVLGVVGEVPPDPGNDIKLTIDLGAQQVAERALQDALAYARGSGHENASRGAIVAMDVSTGAVLAMASAPTYDPGSFVGGISSELWEELNKAESGYPMTNRAIAGLYPAASTYKAFSGLAGLTYNLVDNESEFVCLGTWTGFGEEYPKKCWNLYGHGALDIYHALAYSCDVYFYEVAKAFYGLENQPEALENYLKSWGFGSVTGIDLGGEAAGRVPTREWKEEYFKDTPESAIWVPGDLANMVIGQGDVLVTPLQMCTAYCGIATGKLLKPHVLYQVLNSDGQVVISEPIKESDFKPQFTNDDITAIREGLRLGVISGGVSSVFQGFGVNMAAKSGTGETGSALRDDYAWFCAYGPYEDPKFACACVVEEGGGGTATAGPPVRKVMAQLLGLDSDQTVYVAETGER